ncbi:hypothetical protein Hanom_Chr05g00429661 [Helianthus anomalus]
MAGTVASIYFSIRFQLFKNVLLNVFRSTQPGPKCFDLGLKTTKEFNFLTYISPLICFDQRLEFFICRRSFER